jgi:hypothetical protein
VQSQSFKQSAVLAALFTGVWGVVGYVWGGQNVIATIVQLPLFFAIILVTMRATNRLTVALFGRFGPKPKPPPDPLPPSTERPVHAQRRRDRRRRSGTRRR